MPCAPSHIPLRVRRAGSLLLLGAFVLQLVALVQSRALTSIGLTPGLLRILAGASYLTVAFIGWRFRDRTDHRLAYGDRAIALNLNAPDRSTGEK
jgi:hypothetical protein